MPKVDLELVKMVLQRNELDIRQTSQILEDIKAEMQTGEDEEKGPPVKKQFVILLSDPNNDLADSAYVGWVLQIAEDENPQTAVDRLVKSAYEYNITPKGRRIPVKSIAEVCEHVGGRLTKEQGLWIKTKEPVEVITSGTCELMERCKRFKAANADRAGESEAQS